MAKLDIHHFNDKYTRAERYVRESAISPRNKELIFAYRDACLLHQVCGKVRLIRVFFTLRDFAGRLGKDFDQATKADLQRIVTSLLDGSLKPTSIGTYKAILKRFMGFILRPNEFPRLEQQPPEIAWLHSHVPKRDQPRIQRCNLLLPSENDALRRACTSPRDRALITLLWETGSRISEAGNLQLKHVTKHERGFTLDLTGKTGSRNVLVIGAAPYLAQWLSIHPFTTDPEAPLWITDRHATTPQHVTYATLRAVLQRLLQRAGIAKRLYPHLFRHSRVTYVLAAGLMNEQQAKTYFGWTPDSDMLATYAHLCDQDANNAILRENNLAPAQPTARDRLPITCPSCKELNMPSATYCTRCTTVLNTDTAHPTTTGHDHTHTVLLQLCKVLVEKGLLDDAASTIHDAGLGTLLRELANKKTNVPRTEQY